MKEKNIFMLLLACSHSRIYHNSGFLYKSTKTGIGSISLCQGRVWIFENKDTPVHEYIFLFLSTRLKFGKIICHFGIVRWNTEAQLYFWNVVKRNGVLRTLKQIHCWLYKNTHKIPKKQQNKVLNCTICEAIWAFLSKNSNNPSERNLWIFPWKRKHFTEATLLHVWLTWGNSPFLTHTNAFFCITVVTFLCGRNKRYLNLIIQKNTWKMTKFEFLSTSFCFAGSAELMLVVSSAYQFTNSWC